VSCWEEISKFVLPDFITTSHFKKEERSIEDFDEDNLQKTFANESDEEERMLQNF